MRWTRRLILVASITVVVGALLLFVRNDGSRALLGPDAVAHRHTTFDSEPTANPDQLGGVSGPEDANPSRGVPAQVGRSGPASGDPFPHVPKTRDTLPLDDDPFGTQSRAEQRWLDRNGYPNMRQIEVYTTAPDGMLQQAADAGDTVAGVLLEERRLRRGDPQAETNLMAAAADGSIYALNVLAGHYGQKGPRTNPAKAYSLTRVMEMLGDYKVPLTRQFVVGQTLDPVAQMQAEADALAMYRSIVQRRKRATGMDRIVIEPRPI